MTYNDWIIPPGVRYLPFLSFCDCPDLILTIYTRHLWGWPAYLCTTTKLFFQTRKISSQSDGWTQSRGNTSRSIWLLLARDQDSVLEFRRWMSFESWLFHFNRILTSVDKSRTGGDSFSNRHHFPGIWDGAPWDYRRWRSNRTRHVQWPPAERKSGRSGDDKRLEWIL